MRVLGRRCGGAKNVLQNEALLLGRDGKAMRVFLLFAWRTPIFTVGKSKLHHGESGNFTVVFCLTSPWWSFFFTTVFFPKNAGVPNHHGGGLLSIGVEFWQHRDKSSSHSRDWLCCTHDASPHTGRYENPRQSKLLWIALPGFVKCRMRSGSFM